MVPFKNSPEVIQFEHKVFPARVLIDTIVGIKNAPRKQIFKMGFWDCAAHIVEESTHGNRTWIIHGTSSMKIIHSQYPGDEVHVEVKALGIQEIMATNHCEK